MTSVNWTRDAAAHLLRRAGFGGAPSEIDARDLLERRIAPLERPSGGFAKNVESPHDSTYMTFLVSLCRELVNAPCGTPGSVITCLVAGSTSLLVRRPEIDASTGTAALT